MWEINSTDICFNITRLWFHTHKSCSKERFIISYRIIWSHYGINITMISEYSHICRLFEWSKYFRIITTSRLHCSISITLHHRTLHYLRHLLFGKLLSKWRIWLALILLIESWLKIFYHMTIDSLFSILLHTWIYSCIYFQTISIYIIWLSILLKVFITPTIQRVWNPRDWVEHILTFIPLRIIFLFRTLSHEILTQKLSEINSRAILMIGTMEIQLQRITLQFLTLTRSQIARFLHLC